MKVKDLFIFLLGTATGAGGMYLALNKSIKEKEARVNKAFEEASKNKEHEPVAKIKETAEEKEPVKESKAENQIPDLTKYTQVLEKVDYTKAAVSEKVKSMTDAVEEQAKELIDSAVKKTGKKPKVPKKVTQDEYDATSENERMRLLYYADGVLANEYDEVYDPVETMGATNFKNFKSTFDTVYIFNYARNCMYEIMQCNSKYSDIVGGDIGR